MVHETILENKLIGSCECVGYTLIITFGVYVYSITPKSFRVIERI